MMRGAIFFAPLPCQYSEGKGSVDHTAAILHVLDKTPSHITRLRSKLSLHEVTVAERSDYYAIVGMSYRVIDKILTL